MVETKQNTTPSSSLLKISVFSLLFFFLIGGKVDQVVSDMVQLIAEEVVTPILATFMIHSVLDGSSRILFPMGYTGTVPKGKKTKTAQLLGNSAQHSCLSKKNLSKGRR